jgi:hypothetical protein
VAVVAAGERWPDGAAAVAASVSGQELLAGGFA